MFAFSHRLCFKLVSLKQGITKVLLYSSTCLYTYTTQYMNYMSVMCVYITSDIYILTFILLLTVSRYILQLNVIFLVFLFMS